jgi:hypothetical protein
MPTLKHCEITRYIIRTLCQDTGKTVRRTLRTPLGVVRRVSGMGNKEKESVCQEGYMKHTDISIIEQAYRWMAYRAKYRPAAPGDGFGGIFLSKEELSDVARLCDESAAYARRFRKEEDTCQFNIGCCDCSNTMAFVYAIEASRLLCAGHGCHKTAKKLLRMAAEAVGND